MRQYAARMVEQLQRQALQVRCMVQAHGQQPGRVAQMALCAAQQRVDL